MKPELEKNVRIAHIAVTATMLAIIAGLGSFVMVSILTAPRVVLVERGSESWIASTFHTQNLIVDVNSRTGTLDIDTNGDDIPFNTLKGTNSDGGNLWIGGGGANTIGAMGNTNLGAENVAVGHFAARDATTMFDSVIIGAAAGRGMTTAADNVAVGRSALQGDGVTAVTGHHNTVVGVNAMGAQATTAEDSVAVGLDALQFVTTGFQNTCVGLEACAKITTGFSNVTVGSHSFENADTAHDNVAVGINSLRDCTSCDHNTVIGRGTGGGITTGESNTIIGGQVTGLAAGLTSNIILADGDGNIRLQDNAGAMTINSTLTDNNDVTLSGTTTKVFSHGNVQARELFNGPTLQQFAVPNTAYTFGEVNQIFISGVVPIFPNDLFDLVVKNSATADTTAHTSHSGAIAAEVTSTRSAGANDLTNTAIECTASGGQVNECFHALAGDVTLDGGSNLTVNSGFIFMTDSTKFIASLGTILPESSGTNAVDISGTPTNAIKMRQAASQIDVDSASLASLNLYNANSTLFTLIVSGGTTCNATVSPTTLSAGANGDISIATQSNCIYRVTANAANSTIDGISQHSDGSIGTLCNIAAVGTLTLLNDTSGTPADGFLLKGGINRILTSNECVIIEYIPTTARWMVIN